MDTLEPEVKKGQRPQDEAATPEAGHPRHRADAAPSVALLAHCGASSNLTGVNPRDGAAVKAWQRAHGVPPTGTIRRSTLAAAQPGMHGFDPRPGDAAQGGSPDANGHPGGSEHPPGYVPDFDASQLHLLPLPLEDPPGVGSHARPGAGAAAGPDALPDDLARIHIRGFDDPPGAGSHARPGAGAAAEPDALPDDLARIHIRGFDDPPTARPAPNEKHRRRHSGSGGR